MSNHVYKLIDLVGSSTTSTDDAIRNAIETAALTVRHIDWFEVTETRGHVVEGRIAHYQVTLKVGFRLAPDTPDGGDASATGGGAQAGGVSGIGTA
ncbi:dodecin [Azohydromonas caseinilytica]|uniref:Dodecin domain-containing protein n=1 Tax=Azohydromonas caseinilytica TaxID=2728836 RepID=A0A848FAG6_9BURK|nr:dodecin [Azohydromonas caseinilytica]NML14971.1 dodecin domain-containing protein [Azohydromonas caseinilytica]